MKEQYFSPDISEFLFLLSKHRVKYLIVGGEAVIYYGYARLTGDIDIFYDRDEKNILKLYLALKQFWNDDIPGITNKIELMQDGIVFQFGAPPNRIDLMNRIENISFNTAWINRIDTRLEFNDKKYNIHYIGLKELIKNKESINRNKDKDDLKFLKSVKFRRRMK